MPRKTEPKIIRSMPIKEVDPTVSIGQDIVKFVLDWIAVNKIRKVDQIEVNLRSSNIESDDLEEFLGTLFFKTPLEKTPLVINQTPMKYKCSESHVTADASCDICGTDARDLPSIELKIKSKKGSIELKL